MAPPTGRFLALLVLLLLLLLLSGCLTPATPPSVADATTPTLHPTRFVCPPGGDLQRQPGVCVSTLQRPAQALTEPNLAIDPNDPDRLALGVNAGNGVVLDPAAVLPLDASPFRSDVFLSEDGGVSWSHLRPPVPLLERARYGSADTDVLIDEDGTLHVTALAITASATNSFELHMFHTATQDGGATWSTPRLFFDDGFDDRNWNTLGPQNTFLVTWSRPSASEVAWTRDDGVSWERLTVEGCRGPRPIVYDGGSPLLACRGAAAEIYTLDLENGTSALRAAPLDGWPFAFTRGGDGALWLGAWTEVDGPVVLRSQDGGATWQQVLVLAQVADVPPQPLAVRALEADPWGNVHLLLEHLEGPCQDHVPLMGRGACPSETAFGGGTYHLGLASDGAPGALTRLTPDEMRHPPPAAVAAWDDYHTIAFAADHGYAVWTYDKGLDIVRVEQDA